MVAMGSVGSSGRFHPVRVVFIAALLSGCSTFSGGQGTHTDRIVTSPIADSTAARAARAGVDYERNPQDPKAAIAYGRALRELGSALQASLVLARTAAHNPHHAELLAEYAKALTAAGKSDQALPMFARARQLKAPDWPLLSAEGVALDQVGKHRDARERYFAALKLSPNNPDILANLGLNYALSGRLDDAEATLRQAVAQPAASSQVRQNLALVLAKRGRYAEAERLARADLDPQTAERNVAAMRRMFGAPARSVAAREMDAVAAANGPETSPANMPVVLREETLPSGLTAAVQPQPRPTAPPHAARKQKPATPLPSGNGVDEGFFGFPW